MIRRPPISTRTDTLFPYTTLFRSPWLDRIERLDVDGLPQSWQQSAARVDLEAVDDAHGPGPRGGAVLRGGTSVLGDQARCPFRGYALHRLAIRALETPAHGLQAYDRGNLVHDVLERRSEERRVGQECVRTCRTRW